MNVSRETSERLEIYDGLLRKWQKKINLVSPKTLDDAWTRHFEDSMQLVDSVESTPSHWVDLGSGGGFPGLVCAIIFQDRPQRPKFTLIESDARKCSFLREVARQTDTDVTVLTSRIEAAPAQNADIVSARALAPLDRLLPLAARHLSPNGVCLFLKGVNHKDELDALGAHWQMKVESVASVTSDNSVILKLSEISHVERP